MTLVTTLLLTGLAGLGLVALLAAVQVYDARRWRQELVAYQLTLPRQVTVEDVARWLAAVAATTHPPRRSLVPLWPVVLEVRATARGIRHYLLVDASSRAALLANLQANLPGARLEPVPEYLLTPLPGTVAREYTATSRSRPLAIERASAVSASLLAALQPLQGAEQLTLQLIMTSAGTPTPRPARHANGATLPWWLEGQAPADADALRAERLKQREPLLAAVLRLGATAASQPRAAQLLRRAGAMLPGLNAPGVRLVPRLLPVWLAARWLVTRRYPLLLWPLLVNVREAAGLVALPYGAQLPGLALAQARQLPPSPLLPEKGALVGCSNYPGLAARPLALHTADRLRHLHLIGPTGVGKSTLLAQLALQDIADGAGVVVLDPKGDLISDIAARIPAERLDEVVIIDPSEVTAQVTGFNPLAVAGGDSASRELIADHVLSIMHSLYREFWGPRTDEILRATLFSLTHVPAPDGTAFTLMEVPELLTNPALRRYVSGHRALPPYLKTFWQWFDGALSEADRTQAIGPVLNKLRAFSMRSSLRLLLGQSQGLTFEHLYRRQGIVLISLANGKLGGEAANLLGALFVATLWQAAQARVRLPPAQRRPVFAYLDEFQDIVRLGANDSLADMLAQARGLGLSLTLAHQYLSQLPATVKEATLGTVRTHLAFQLEWDDARALEARFAPLTRDDLAGLRAYEFALKPCVDGQTLAPLTGSTLPLGAARHDPAAVATASRERYGAARAAIDAGLRARTTVPAGQPSGRFGREATDNTGSKDRKRGKA